MKMGHRAFQREKSAQTLQHFMCWGSSPEFSAVFGEINAVG